MHFWAVAAMNCHEVAELRASDDLPQMQGNLQCIGSSLEASLDLINHSCVHNVLRFNCGRSTVLVACQDIKEGEEVQNYNGLLSRLVKQFDFRSLFLFYNEFYFVL